MCLRSVIVKVLESIVKDTLLLHFSQHNILFDKQYGFIPHRPCCTQFLSALNNWTSALDQGFSTDVIYFDFSNTFDTVPHNRLFS